MNADGRRVLFLHVTGYVLVPLAAAVPTVAGLAAGVPAPRAGRRGGGAATGQLRLGAPSPAAREQAEGCLDLPAVRSRSGRLPIVPKCGASASQ
jgi:hypothetical protein